MKGTGEMDRFNQLVEEFTPTNIKQYDRDMVVKLMELAFRLGQNCGMELIRGTAEKAKMNSGPQTTMV